MDHQKATRLTSIFSIILAQAISPAVSHASPAHMLDAKNRLVLVKYDQETLKAVGLARDGATNRKAFADLLKVLREAGVDSVFLDFSYAKRPNIADDNARLADEFTKYNVPGAPMLQVCNPKLKGPLGNSEDFITLAKWGICATVDTEVRTIANRTQRNSAAAAYCMPVLLSGPGVGTDLVSDDPQDISFSKNASCLPEDRFPVVNILEHLGIQVPPQRFAKTKILDDKRVMGSILEILPLAKAPIELSMIDILIGKVDPQILKGRAIIIGTTIPGQDESVFGGATEHGVYSYIFAYLAMVDDSYRDTARNSIQKNLP
jgi:hypothetical protein